LFHSVRAWCVYRQTYKNSHVWRCILRVYLSNNSRLILENKALHDINIQTYAQPTNQFFTHLFIPLIPRISSMNQSIIYLVILSNSFSHSTKSGKSNLFIYLFYLLFIILSFNHSFILSCSQSFINSFVLTYSYVSRNLNLQRIRQVSL